ncbi:MAG TPA: sensor histidine kinase [Solirubrobacteraceae bacterium]|jgi:signal transduction histidine kinase|nr:sensor histidine kinase [Solirubrobacteraceae bacterium]
MPALSVRGPLTRTRIVALTATALVVGLADALLLATSDHFEDGTVWAVFGPFISWGFVGTGLYAWWRRPDSRFGALLVALGYAWLLAPLPASSNPVMFTAGIVVGSLWGPLLAHALLSFPTGRLRNRRERVLVIFAYAVVPLASVPALLVADADVVYTCDGPCPENVLLIEKDTALGEAIEGVASGVVMATALLVVVFLAMRWRAAGRSERRSLAPLFAAGGGTLALIVLQVAIPVEAFTWLAFVAFAATPFAFLAGLVRADVSQSRGVRALVARLGDLREPADLRDALADALGDPTLRLAFWLPEQARYVDAAGAPMAADDRQMVTEIERDGRRIAAFVHDRELAEHTETVRAAGAAAALLLENQRLDAELRAHIVELRASRARIVEAADTERRRLERNLHDGAQSRLVTLALNLRLGRTGLDAASPAAALIDASIEEVRQSLAELRELARGIHPPVLSERGLEPALRVLAARAPLPVEFVGGLAGRLPSAVETAAYFVVSEALTNVAKYAQAEHATVRVEREDGRLMLEISDDGVGGATPAGGSGLRGLADRVAALDGELDITSPRGEGTCLRVKLPCR